jgi:hypothetical protein
LGDLKNMALRRIDFNSLILKSQLLLEQYMSKFVLDLEAIKSQLDFAYKRGIVADHSRLIVWQAKENIQILIDQLNKIGE